MNINSLNTYNNYVYANNTNFKANPIKKPSTFASLSVRAAIGAKKINKVYNNFVENVMAKRIVAPMMNSKLAEKIADKTAHTEKMTDYMTTAGSFVTTTVYANRTLKKKDLEKKPARTLALNQILVTALSTVLSFTINDSLAGMTKKMGYKFRNNNQHLPDKILANRMKGFGIAQKLLTFSLMYRYVAPVLVTPVASKIGKALNSDIKKTEKK